MTPEIIAKLRADAIYYSQLDKLTDSPQINEFASMVLEYITWTKAQEKQNP